MSKLTSREKGLLIFAISFILIFSLTKWFVLPFWNQSANVDKELLQAEQSLRQAKAIIQKEGKYLAKYAAYVKAYEEMKSDYYLNLEENEAMLKFLAQIEELALESGIKIVSKTAEGVSNLEEWKMLKVNLTLKGTSRQMTDLLLAFRNSPVVINIQRLRIDLDRHNQLLQIKLVVSTLILGEAGVDDV